MSETLHGKYPVTLIGAHKYTAPDGQDAILFTWGVDGLGVRATSKLLMKDSAGGRANAIINGTRAWMPAWDGNDLNWFVTKFRRCRGAKAVIQFDQGEVEWVFPATAAQGEDALSTRGAAQCGQGVPALRNSPAAQGEGAPLTLPARPRAGEEAQGTIAVRLVVKPENVAKAPCNVTPDFAHTKAFFDIFTEGTQREDASYFWTQLAAKIGPMQIDFTSDDWQKMIDMIRMLRTKTVMIEKRGKKA